MARNTTIDILKGFCIILVVIGHFTPSYSPQWYRTMVDIIYTFHMPAFMAASGFLYILTYREERYTRFVFRKSQRLLLPYIITSLIIVTIKYATQNSLTVDNPVTPQSYITILYLPEAGYFLWFLWALFLIFLIAPLLTTRKSHIIFLAASTILSLLPIEYPTYFCINQCIRFMPYFALGMVCADNLTLIRKCTSAFRGGYNILCISALTFLTISCIYLSCQPSPILMLFLGILGTTAAALLSLGYKRLNLPRTIILITAEASFIIYLFHTTFQGFAKALIPKTLTGNPIIAPIIILSVILVGILGPTVLYRVLRKHPVTSSLFGIPAKKTVKDK